ncbi:unnamed protein product [Owenia fusiformis]|uniref:Uncharacterized protein n=1 Tax=Owenia fusiformis TaxID=6347 RepID=A0A8S4QCK6_OWEFU|nr:unnamed protein product [Owenia fusiformis]
MEIFHLKPQDVSKVGGTIVKPLETGLPRMLKLAVGPHRQQTILFPTVDHVFMKTYDVLDVQSKHDGSLQVPFEPQSSDPCAGRITRQEFDYFIECCQENGCIFSKDNRNSSKYEQQALYTYGLDHWQHLGRGYEFTISSNYKTLEIVSNRFNEEKEIYEVNWSLCLTFQQIHDLLNNIWLITEPLTLAEKNCLSTLHDDHLNQMGMWSCNVCQFINRRTVFDKALNDQ